MNNKNQSAGSNASGSIFPVAIFLTIVLACMKLAGVAISWLIVFLPMIVYFIPVAIIFIVAFIVFLIECIIGK